MTGQGWVWLGGAGMTSLGVLNHATLRGAMKGAVGTMPKSKKNPFSSVTIY